MAKAILLVRVSTDKQSFDEQEKQVYDMAIADGYTDDDIIIIAEKESGIKLSEEKRKGLNRMKEVIANEDVAIVYAWEISRIARKKKVLFSILDYLTERKIQLAIYEPNIRLLNDDGTINDASETIFTLFAQMAESEMRTKAARWTRTKKAMAEQGKWTGGWKPHFGYSVDKETKKYVINEDEAKVIRMIFNLYVNSNMGYSRIAKELAKRGYKMSRNVIGKLISDPTYTGEHQDVRTVKGKKFYGNKRTWPIIIDKETWEKAKYKRENTDKSHDKSSKYYFGALLIKCPNCGRHWTMTAQKDYRCMGCGGQTISLNLIDSLLWYDVVDDYQLALGLYREGNMSELNDQLNVLQEKLAHCEKVIGSVDDRLERIAISYQDGMITHDKMLERRDEVLAEIKEAENDRQQHLANIDKINEMIETLKNDNDLTARLNRIDDEIQDINDFKQMYEIIHQYIGYVTVKDIEFNGSKYVKEIAIFHKFTDEIHRFHYYYRKQKGCKLYAYTFRENNYVDQELWKRGHRFEFEVDDIKWITRWKPQKKSKK